MAEGRFGEPALDCPGFGDKVHLVNLRGVNGLRLVVIATSTLAVAACSPTNQRSSATGNYAESALANPRFLWDSISTAAFTLYTPRGSYAAARASQYRAEVADGITHALAMLGESSYPAHLRLFVMGSREDVESVTGIGWNGWTDAAGNNAAVVARPECRPVFKHEIMHAVSLRLWGNPLGPDKDPSPPADSALMARGGWLREGIAAAAEDLYGNFSYRGMAAQWLAEGTIFPFDTLVNRFYQVDDLAAYLQSGSLVNYLLGQYGHDRFRIVWREGPSAFPRAYARTAAQIESEWHAWLRATPPSTRPASIALARSQDRCPRRRK